MHTPKFILLTLILLTITSFGMCQETSAVLEGSWALKSTLITGLDKKAPLTFSFVTSVLDNSLMRKLTVEGCGLLLYSVAVNGKYIIIDPLTSGSMSGCVSTHQANLQAGLSSVFTFSIGYSQLSMVNPKGQKVFSLQRASKTQSIESLFDGIWVANEIGIQKLPVTVSISAMQLAFCDGLVTYTAKASSNNNAFSVIVGKKGVCDSPQMNSALERSQLYQITNETIILLDNSLTLTVRLKKVAEAAGRKLEALISQASTLQQKSRIDRLPLNSSTFVKKWAFSPKNLNSKAHADKDMMLLVLPQKIALYGECSFYVSSYYLFGNSVQGTEDPKRILTIPKCVSSLDEDAFGIIFSPDNLFSVQGKSLTIYDPLKTPLFKFEQVNA